MTPFELLSLLQQKQHLEWESRRCLEERTYYQAKSILQSVQEGTVPQKIISDAKERVQLYEEGLKVARQFNLPPLQSIADFVNSIKFKTWIDEGLSSFGDLKPNMKVFIGSLEVMNINAWVTKVNDKEEYLIILHSGLLNTLSTITNILSVTMELHSGIIDHEKIEQALPFFVGAVKKYVFYLESEDYAMFQLDWHTQVEERWLEMDMLCKMIVFAHEYSHILLGHFDNPMCLMSVEWATGVNELASNKRDELMADIIAFQSVVFSHPMPSSDYVQDFGFRIAGAWLSIVIFFETMRMFERAKTIAGIETQNSSHPESRERVDSILSFIRTKKPRYDFLVYLHALEGGVRNCFNSLWMKAEKELSTYAHENMAKIQEIYSQMSI